MRLFIILIMVIFLKAEDISYSFNLSNKTPYEREAITLDVNITQQDHSSVMFFKFAPKKSENYIFKQINFKEDEKYHALKYQYRYIIYPLKEGKISLLFNMIKSVTNDVSVAYAISGDRDNIKDLVKKDTKIDLKPLTLDVKPLPKDTVLVGDFKIDYNIDKINTKAYDPIYLHIDIKGKGYLKPFQILSKSEKYHIFKQNPKVTKNSLSYDYAISSKESFTIPPIDLKSFNPKTKKSYHLKVPAHHIKVNNINSKSLLDKEDNPISIKKRDIDWSWIGWLFSYIIVFITGLLTPKDILKRKKRKKEDDIKEKIASSKTHKELLKLLLYQNNIKYQKAINQLESVIYSGKKIPLETIMELIL